MLSLLLIRIFKEKGYTEGVLFDKTSNKFLCHSLEDTVRDINGDGDLNDEGEGKVYGKTAIPYGTYDIEVTYSPKFNKDMILVKDVKHFEGIRIHWGRTADNLEGCIGVGAKERGGVLANTGMTDKLVKMLLDNGNRGIIEII